MLDTATIEKEIQELQKGYNAMMEFRGHKSICHCDSCLRDKVMWMSLKEKLRAKEEFYDYD